MQLEFVPKQFAWSKGFHGSLDLAIFRNRTHFITFDVFLNIRHQNAMIRKWYQQFKNSMIFVLSCQVFLDHTKTCNQLFQIPHYFLHRTSHFECSWPAARRLCTACEKCTLSLQLLLIRHHHQSLSDANGAAAVATAAASHTHRARGRRAGWLAGGGGGLRSEKEIDQKSQTRQRRRRHLQGLPRRARAEGLPTGGVRGRTEKLDYGHMRERPSARVRERAPL